MILSRFYLNPASRDVQRCIADSHDLHARVMSLFAQTDDNCARASLGVLHRLEMDEREGLIALLVQSSEAPDATRWPSRFLDPRAGEDAAATTSLEPVLSSIKVGARFRFRLRANPTRKIDTKTQADGKRRNGKRVPVRGDEGRTAWLMSRLEAHGMRVASIANEPMLRQRSDGTTTGRRARALATHEAHVFEGVVEVVDAELARQAFAHGIGPAKAFGFGLLSLAPAD